MRERGVLNTDFSGTWASPVQMSQSTYSTLHVEENVEQEPSYKHCGGAPEASCHVGFLRRHREAEDSNIEFVWLFNYRINTTQEYI